MSRNLRVGLVAAFTTFALGTLAQETLRDPAVYVLAFVADDPADSELARQIASAVADRLRKSGKLTVREPPGDDAKPDARAEGRVIRRPDQRIDVQTRLWDVDRGTLLSGHQYTIEASQWQLVAGAISEAVLESLVGRPPRPGGDRQ